MNERLLDVRTDADLTQSEIAEILKTTQSNYSRWEKGTELIPLKKLNLLCNYFNISMDYVIGKVKEETGNGKHDINLKVIGTRLRIVRHQFDLTQKDLANLFNTSQSTVSAYENGKTMILTAFALEIVEKYNISLDWLCGRIK